MNAMAVFIVLALPFSWLSIVSAQEQISGRECYKCLYIDGIPVADLDPDHHEKVKNWFDESCDINRTPEAKFLTNCELDKMCGLVTIKGKKSERESETTVIVRECASMSEAEDGICIEMPSTDPDVQEAFDDLSES